MGDIYKLRLNELLNYKEVCEEMNDTLAFGGRSRKQQLVKWQREYEIEKIGTKYIIKRELKEYEKTIAESHGKFTTYIENLLVWIHKTKYKGNSDIRMGYRELFEYLNIVNSTYYPTKYSHKKQYEYLTEENKFNKLDINDTTKELFIFFDTSHNLLKRMIKDSLESMQKNNLIVYSKAYRLYKEIYNTETKQTIFESHDCTDEEISQILTFYGDIMLKFNITTGREIFLLNNTLKKEFYAQVDDLIKEKYGYNNHCETFKIIVADNLENRINVSNGLKKINENVKEKLCHSEDFNNRIPKNILEQFIKDFINTI